MIDIKKAKTRFLSLAFSGMIIDFPNKEKRNLILEKVHSSIKNYVPVTEEEHLIKTPSYWNWSRLGYLTNNHGQIVPESDFCYIDVGTLDNIHNRLASKENHIVAVNAPSRARKKVQLGDVLYSTVRPYLHNICIIDRSFSKTPIASTAFCVMKTTESVLNNKFLFYWLLTTEFDKYSSGDSKGALYPAIGEKDFLKGVIPIPPLEEQLLIVEKIENVFSTLDTIDELQAIYADNLAVLKSKIIDLAVQGKLTEQLPEDGTAEELYQQIQEEKQALIKEGKIKKERPLPDISDTEIPFDIPDNWKWCRLGSVSEIAGGTTPKANEMSETGDIPYFKVSDMNVLGNETHMIHASCFISESYSGKIFPKGTIIYPKNGGAALTNKRRMLINNSAIDLNTGGCTPLLESTTKWVRFLFETIDFNDMNTGSNIPTVNATALKRRLVPIPPLSEQKRIVKKLDEVLEIVNI